MKSTQIPILGRGVRKNRARGSGAYEGFSRMEDQNKVENISGTVATKRKKETKNVEIINSFR